MRTKAKNRVALNGDVTTTTTKLATSEPEGRGVVIPAPNLREAVFTIVGTSPYVQNKFSSKARELMRAAQEAGSQAKKGKKKEPKDFQACYEGAMYTDSEHGWHGIPSHVFRNAMISACRLVGFKMTHAKLSVFCVSDGYDASSGRGLTKITKGTPRYHEEAVRNDSGVADIRPRPMWAPGWEAEVRLRWDGDQFSTEDIANLLARCGLQVGIGEGRHDSKESNGLGWGCFNVKPRHMEVR